MCFVFLAFSAKLIAYGIVVSWQRPLLLLLLLLSLLKAQIQIQIQNANSTYTHLGTYTHATSQQWQAKSPFASLWQK